jgi:hypothetical protein
VDRIAGAGSAPNDSRLLDAVYVSPADSLIGSSPPWSFLPSPGGAWVMIVEGGRRPRDPYFGTVVEDAIMMDG